MEYDTSLNLMQKDESLFKKMVTKAGIDEVFQIETVKKRKPAILANSRQTSV